MKFTPIMDQELPNGTHLITLREEGITGRWTVIVTTDGLSDRVINPRGEIITPGPVDGKIPADLWFVCGQVIG